MRILRCIPITDTWIILVVHTLPNVVQAIDGLSGGAYLPLVQRWEATKDIERPDWNARRAMFAMRDANLAAARQTIGEAEITATCSGIAVEAQYLHYVGIGATETPGGTDPEYVVYCYVRLAEPMEELRLYTFDIGNTAITYVHRQDPTRAIKANQVGYLSDAPRKIAYVGCWIPGHGALEIGAHAFGVMNAENGQCELVGNVVERHVSDFTATGRQITGERVYECDFTDLRPHGDFYIYVPGVGHSWTFRHAPDAYGPAFYTAMRGLYHQRCGLPLRTPLTNWKRGQCHRAPVGESLHIEFPRCFTDAPRLNRFDVIGATIDKTNARPVLGGWHDAADWDRNNAHYAVVYDLLYVYEMAPDKFRDGQLQIWESGDGIPDILNEAAWGLRVWASSMTADGGVSGMVETNGHPPLDIDGDYAFSRRTRWDALLFAGAAAMLAEFLVEFDGRQSDRWDWYARRAYRYGADPQNSMGKATIPARTNRGAGDWYSEQWEERPEHIAPFLFHAKARMYRLTGDRRYLEGMAELGKDIAAPWRWPWVPSDYSGWLVFGALPVLPEPHRSEVIRKSFVDYAEGLLRHLESQPYRCTFPRGREGFGWGQGSMANYSRALLVSYHLTGSAKYRDAALLNLDFMLGCNPMGMSWTTGFGSCYPIAIQHAVSQSDGIDDPVPGITIYGPTGGMYRELRDQIWDGRMPEHPVWRSWSAHPTKNTAQCEFTIQETMSAMAFCAAFLAPQAWQPPDEPPKPRTTLHGRFYLP